MTEYQGTFERHEKKYLLNGQQYNEIRLFLEKYMRGDEYKEHTVCSLYFDTNNYSLIRASNEKPLYKEKLRLRSYGIPKLDDLVFLEIKKKFDGIVYKRRIPLKLSQANSYMKSGIKPQHSSQIFQEIDWFVKRYKLESKAILACNRIALYGIENEDLRVTFDFKIRWRDYDLDLAKGDFGEFLIPHQECIMEVKTTSALPMWLSGYLSQKEIYPTSFSKYGRCYRENLMEGGMFHVG